MTPDNKDFEEMNSENSEPLNEEVKEAAEEPIETTAEEPAQNTGYSYSGAAVGETFSLGTQRSEAPHSEAPHSEAPHFETLKDDKPVKTEIKKKDKKRGLGAGGIAILVAVCILVSALAGFGGAYMYGEVKNSGIIGGNVVVNKVESSGEQVSITQGSVSEVIANISDTVVEITTEAVVKGSFFGNYVSEGAGSGVIMSEDGYIITNNHVISGADTIKVRAKDGTEYSATLISTDSQADIAVIKVDANSLHAVTFGSSDSVTVGEPAIAIGNPLGELGGTVTTGIVSALDREVAIDGNTMRLLQTDASINPGNSGGGLFNMKGELIGIVNAKSAGSDVEGLGFAIPVDTAYAVATELISKGYVSGRPMLGITIAEISSMNDYMKYANSELGKYIEGFGVYVVADERGNFQLGDRIVAVDGTNVESLDNISGILSNHSVGDEVTVTVYRSRKTEEVKVTLVEKTGN